MTSYGSNLPPGCPGPHPESIEFRCVNPSCAYYGDTHEVSGTWELGGVFLDREEDSICPECGWDRMGEGEWNDYYPITQDETGDPVLVSIHDDVAIRGLPRAALLAIKPVLQAEYEERRRQLQLGKGES